MFNIRICQPKNSDVHLVNITVLDLINPDVNLIGEHHCSWVDKS